MDKFIDLHTHYETESDEVIAIVNQFPFDFYPENYYSIGIHPWHISHFTLREDLLKISWQSKDAQCLAIGECGLDNKIETSLEEQIEIFEAQLEIAARFEKPVILHCVGYYQEVAKLCLKYRITAIFHGFGKASLPLAQDLISKGFYLSFGHLLFESPKLAEVFRQLPKDRVFLETDSSSYSIMDIYQHAEDICGISNLKDQLFKNYIKIFYNN